MFVFSVGVVMRRKLTVSLTIIVLSGITSDVGERSSVRSDGICQRKGKWDYTRLSVKKKKELKNTQIERRISTYFEFLHSQFCQSRKRQWHEILWDFNSFCQHLPVALKAAWRSTTLVKKAIFTIHVSKIEQSFQVSWEFKLNEGITLSLKLALLF